MMECHAVGGDAGGRLADVVQEPGQAEHGSGSSPSIAANVWRSTSLCRWTGSCSRRRAGTGMNPSARPVSTSRVRPAPGPPDEQLVELVADASGETMQTLPHPPDASTTRGAGETPSCDTKQAARTMQAVVRERDLGIERRVEPLRREVLHALERVHERPSGSRIAIALIVKSVGRGRFRCPWRGHASFRSSSGSAPRGTS